MLRSSTCLSTLLLSISCILLVACGGGSDREAASICQTGAAVETNGHRRLALVVGVGDYASDDVPDLSGTTVDARRIYDLLTSDKGYGFPKENVCLLLDDEATGANFRRAFDDALVNRAQADDIAVVFFAGHGSQIWDFNEDEPDGWDETLVFHDALTSETGEIVDDDFHQMLRQLHARTQNIVTILDSCNSGTATRAASAATARFVPPTERTIQTFATDGDGEGDLASRSLPGHIVLTAASDGTPALEQADRGIFTDALVQVLSQVSERPLTYAQVARQVPPLVASSSYQIPYFQGDLNRAVFGNTGRTRPIGWDVVAVGDTIELSGPPLPGFGIGAELRVYDGAATGTDVTDPGKAKATVVVSEATGLNGTARISAAAADAAPVVAGDLAMLVRPADEYLSITVSIRDADLPGGVPENRAERLRAALAENREAVMLVRIAPSLDDFELSVSRDDRLVLRGPENRVRMVFDRDAAAVRNLWQHARQNALLRLQGEGGEDFVDQQTLSVQLVPATEQPSCADGRWIQAEPGQEQIVPMCHRYHVRVKLAAESPMPLRIGGLFLSTDGSIYGFPADGSAIVLQPGADRTLTEIGKFYGKPPLDVQDRLMVFGTQETNPVQWHLLTETAARRAASPLRPKSGLHGALDRYLRPGTRGVGAEDAEIEDTTWTMSSLMMRVEANERFERPEELSDTPDHREYTLSNFDIRPYLPANQDTALFAVLNKADDLARQSIAGDGFGYKQHDWSLPTLEENLAKGIDCSRAIWHVFDSVGLPYNDDDNRYIATADMVGDASIMSNQFDQCPEQAGYRLGDILVYRSDTKNDGHVVMVVDPKKRIAWGSHGWDGNAKASDYVVEPDTGVEYQIIRYKQDWTRWDRSDMEFKACWRYRRFTEEADEAMELRGYDGEDPCSSRVCPASRT